MESITGLTSATEPHSGTDATTIVKVDDVVDSWVATGTGTVVVADGSASTIALRTILESAIPNPLKTELASLRLALDTCRRDKAALTEKVQAGDFERSLLSMALDATREDARTFQRLLLQLRYDPFSTLAVNAALQRKIGDMRLSIDSLTLESIHLKETIFEISKVRSATALESSQKSLQIDRISAENGLLVESVLAAQAALSDSARRIAELETENSAQRRTVAALEKSQPLPASRGAFSGQGDTPIQDMHSNSCEFCGFSSEEAFAEQLDANVRVASLSSQVDQLRQSSHQLNTTYTATLDQLVSERDHSTEVENDLSKLKIQYAILEESKNTSLKKMEAYMSLNEEHHNRITTQYSFLRDLTHTRLKESASSREHLYSQIEEFSALFKDILGIIWMLGTSLDEERQCRLRVERAKQEFSLENAILLKELQTRARLHDSRWSLFQKQAVELQKMSKSTIHGQSVDELAAKFSAASTILEKLIHTSQYEMVEASATSHLAGEARMLFLESRLAETETALADILMNDKRHREWYISLNSELPALETRMRSLHDSLQTYIQCHTDKKTTEALEKEVEIGHAAVTDLYEAQISRAIQPNRAVLAHSFPVNAAPAILSMYGRLWQTLGLGRSHPYLATAPVSEELVNHTSSVDTSRHLSIRNVFEQAASLISSDHPATNSTVITSDTSHSAADMVLRSLFQKDELICHLQRRVAELERENPVLSIKSTSIQDIAVVSDIPYNDSSCDKWTSTSDRPLSDLQEIPSESSQLNLICDETPTQLIPFRPIKVSPSLSNDEGSSTKSPKELALRNINQCTESSMQVGATPDDLSIFSETDHDQATTPSDLNLQDHVPYSTTTSLVDSGHKLFECKEQLEESTSQVAHLKSTMPNLEENLEEKSAIRLIPKNSVFVQTDEGNVHDGQVQTDDNLVWVSRDKWLQLEQERSFSDQRELDMKARIEKLISEHRSEIDILATEKHSVNNHLSDNIKTIGLMTTVLSEKTDLVLNLEATAKDLRCQIGVLEKNDESLRGQIVCLEGELATSAVEIDSCLLQIDDLKSQHRKKLEDLSCLLSPLAKAADLDMSDEVALGAWILAAVSAMQRVKPDYTDQFSQTCEYDNTENTVLMVDSCQQTPSSPTVPHSIDARREQTSVYVQCSLTDSVACESGNTGTEIYSTVLDLKSEAIELVAQLSKLRQIYQLLDLQIASFQKQSVESTSNSLPTKTNEVSPEYVTSDLYQQAIHSLSTKDQENTRLQETLSSQREQHLGELAKLTDELQGATEYSRALLINLKFSNHCLADTKERLLAENGSLRNEIARLHTANVDLARTSPTPSAAHCHCSILHNDERPSTRVITIPSGEFNINQSHQRFKQMVLRDKQGVSAWLDTIGISHRTAASEQKMTLMARKIYEYCEILVGLIDLVTALQTRRDCGGDMMIQWLSTFPVFQTMSHMVDITANAIKSDSIPAESSTNITFAQLLFGIARDARILESQAACSLSLVHVSSSSPLSTDQRLEMEPPIQEDSVSAHEQVLETIKAEHLEEKKRMADYCSSLLTQQSRLQAVVKHLTKKQLISRSEIQERDHQIALQQSHHMHLDSTEVCVQTDFFADSKATSEYIDASTTTIPPESVTVGMQTDLAESLTTSKLLEKTVPHAAFVKLQRKCGEQIKTIRKQQSDYEKLKMASQVANDSVSKSENASTTTTDHQIALQQSHRMSLNSTEVCVQTDFFADSKATSEYIDASTTTIPPESVTVGMQTDLAESLTTSKLLEKTVPHAAFVKLQRKCGEQIKTIRKQQSDYEKLKMASQVANDSVSKSENASTTTTDHQIALQQSHRMSLNSTEVCVQTDFFADSKATPEYIDASTTTMDHQIALQQSHRMPLSSTEVYVQTDLFADSKATSEYIDASTTTIPPESVTVGMQTDLAESLTTSKLLEKTVPHAAFVKLQRKCGEQIKTIRKQQSDYEKLKMASQVANDSVSKSENASTAKEDTDNVAKCRDCSQMLQKLASLQEQIVATVSERDTIQHNLTQMEHLRISDEASRQAELDLRASELARMETHYSKSVAEYQASALSRAAQIKQQKVVIQTYSKKFVQAESRMQELELQASHSASLALKQDKARIVSEREKLEAVELCKPLNMQICDLREKNSELSSLVAELQTASRVSISHVSTQTSRVSEKDVSESPPVILDQDTDENAKVINEYQKRIAFLETQLSSLKRLHRTTKLKQQQQHQSRESIMTQQMNLATLTHDTETALLKESLVIANRSQVLLESKISTLSRFSTNGIEHLRTYVRTFRSDMVDSIKDMRKMLDYLRSVVSHYKVVCESHSIKVDKVDSPTTSLSYQEQGTDPIYSVVSRFQYDSIRTLISHIQSALAMSVDPIKKHQDMLRPHFVVDLLSHICESLHTMMITVHSPDNMDLSCSLDLKTWLVARLNTESMYFADNAVHRNSTVRLNQSYMTDSGYTLPNVHHPLASIDTLKHSHDSSNAGQGSSPNLVLTHTANLPKSSSSHSLSAMSHPLTLSKPLMMDRGVTLSQPSFIPSGDSIDINVTTQPPEDEEIARRALEFDLELAQMKQHSQLASAQTAQTLSERYHRGASSPSLFPRLGQTLIEQTNETSKTANLVNSDSTYLRSTTQHSMASRPFQPRRTSRHSHISPHLGLQATNTRNGHHRQKSIPMHTGSPKSADRGRKSDFVISDTQNYQRENTGRIPSLTQPSQATATEAIGFSEQSLTEYPLSRRLFLGTTDKGLDCPMSVLLGSMGDTMFQQADSSTAPPQLQVDQPSLAPINTATLLLHAGMATTSQIDGDVDSDIQSLLDHDLAHMRDLTRRSIASTANTIRSATKLDSNMEDLHMDYTDSSKRPDVAATVAMSYDDIMCDDVMDSGHVPLLDIEMMKALTQESVEQTAQLLRQFERSPPR